jgi:hypothetical protein
MDQTLDELCRLRSDLKSHLFVDSVPKEQIDKYIKALDEVISMLIRSDEDW